MPVSWPLALVSLLSAYLTGVAVASWAPLTDEELCARSDAIVAAELIGRTSLQVSTDAGELTIGVLRVTESLRPDSLSAYLLLVLPSSTGPISSSDLHYSEGQTGWWFLRESSLAASGLYLADHPQRFVSAAEDPKRMKRLREIIESR